VGLRRGGGVLELRAAGVMAVFETEHTARKAHACCLCTRPIKPGARYSMQVMTPRDPEMENTRWIRLRAHITYRECENASE
jgi:hypothetical protein